MYTYTHIHVCTLGGRGRGYYYTILHTQYYVVYYTHSSTSTTPHTMYIHTYYVVHTLHYTCILYTHTILYTHVVVHTLYQ